MRIRQRQRARFSASGLWPFWFFAVADPSVIPLQLTESEITHLKQPFRPMLTHCEAIDQILLKDVIRPSRQLVSVTTTGVFPAKTVRLHAVDESAVELGEYVAPRRILPVVDGRDRRRLDDGSHRFEPCSRGAKQHNCRLTRRSGSVCRGDHVEHRLT